MKNRETNDNRRGLKNKDWMKRWRRGLLCLSCAVAFCTVYALILPADALEKKTVEAEISTTTDETNTTTDEISVTTDETSITTDETNTTTDEISITTDETILTTRWLAGTGLAAVAAGISTGVLTLIVLVFGEITPKTCATINAEKIALANAKIIYTWMVIATPLIFIMNKLSLGILFLMRVDPNAKSDSYTEEDIRTIVDVSHEDGVIEPEERDMSSGIQHWQRSQTGS